MKKLLLLGLFTAQFLGLPAFASGSLYVGEAFPNERTPIAQVKFDVQNNPLALALSNYVPENGFFFGFYDSVVEIQKTNPLTFVTAHGSRFQLDDNGLTVLSDTSATSYSLYLVKSAAVGGTICDNPPRPGMCH
jgi:hypothetical protein